MIKVLDNAKTSRGYKAWKIRTSNKITQQELASLATVSQIEVALFEHNLPIQLEARRRMLKVLWSLKSKNVSAASNGKSKVGR